MGGGEAGSIANIRSSKSMALVQDQSHFFQWLAHVKVSNLLLDLLPLLCCGTFCTSRRFADRWLCSRNDDMAVLRCHFHSRHNPDRIMWNL